LEWVHAANCELVVNQPVRIWRQVPIPNPGLEWVPAASFQIQRVGKTFCVDVVFTSIGDALGASVGVFTLSCGNPVALAASRNLDFGFPSGIIR